MPIDKIYVVGNGPSRADYSWSDALSIGCNLATDTDIVAIMDRQIADGILLKKFTVKCPVILSGNAWRGALRERALRKRLNILGFIEPTHAEDNIDTERDMLNAGHVGVLWALRLGAKRVDLIGFDSLWTGLADSTTDQIIRKQVGKGRFPLNKAPDRWKNSWDTIFRHFPKADLRVHCPEDAKLRHPSLVRSD